MDFFSLKSINFETVFNVAVHKQDTKIRVTQGVADNSLIKITDMKDAVIVTAHVFDNGVDILEF